NDARYTGSSILLARDNFGCGSSREHAPWAILEYGFKAVIAPSFADIFFNNSFKNGLLPVVLAERDVDALFELASGESAVEIDIDLQSQEVKGPNGFSASFEIDPFRKTCLLEGLDEIGLSLKDVDAIKAYEARRVVDAPWLFRD
ncbi:MAG: 3-isopropylmalate dehydratase small subunit, partial [Litorivicinaceae bacterium]